MPREVSRSGHKQMPTLEIRRRLVAGYKRQETADSGRRLTAEDETDGTDGEDDRRSRSVDDGGYVANAAEAAS